jgi:L-aminopeptidase/D-esterase-like protein
VFVQANFGRRHELVLAGIPLGDDLAADNPMADRSAHSRAAAVVQATEEAVVNALVANDDMTGRDGHRTPALPRDRVVEILSRAGRLT